MLTGELASWLDDCVACFTLFVWILLGLAWVAFAGWFDSLVEEFEHFLCGTDCRSVRLYSVTTLCDASMLAYIMRKYLLLLTADFCFDDDAICELYFYSIHNKLGTAILLSFFRSLVRSCS